MSQVNQVDLHESNGSLYLYIHTDSPIRHEAKMQAKQVVLDLYETHVLGNQLGVFYEKAPSIRGVSVKHLEEGHIQLRIEGRQLEMPIVGFRELSATQKMVSSSSHHRTLHRTASLATQKGGDVFLAIESETAKQIPTEIKKAKPLSPNTELKESPQALPSHTLEEANLPTAIASEVLEDESLYEEESPSKGIRQTAYELTLLLAQWAKNNLGLLVGLFILSGLSFLALFKCADFIRRYWLQPSVKPNSAPVTNPLASEPANQVSAFNRMEASVPAVSKPSLSKTQTAKHHTLERVREKMKLAGVAPTSLETPESTEGVNLRVKEAIARKQAQRYSKESGTSSPFVTTPSPSVSTSPSTESGNAFLHAMAQHMDVSGKESIAKALQQSKKYD